MPTTIFLSYARGDDEPFVKRLHADLTKAGFTVWFDRESLMSRGLTFHQEIKDAIRTEVNRVVYIAGPKAAISPYVREEWQFALECDHVVVNPILRLGGFEHVPGELSLLHCEDFRDDANYDAALAKLIASLRQPNPKLGALFAVPSLPPNFLGRPDLMRRVRDALMVDLQTTQVITGADARVGMQGMGGIGKSVLAAALARNRDVRQAYPDGVVWITGGQKLTDDDLIKRQRDLAKHLGGDENFTSLAQAQGVLRELLASKAILLVLDDIWRAADAQAFDVLGPRCRMLVTTRDKGILDTLHGELVPVSLFTEAEALQLLADAVNVATADLPAKAREVARECGHLPLALALCGGMARKRGGDFHSVLERLRRADLEKITDRESINEQHRSIWRAMRASVEMLPEDEQQRFAELSVFATDQSVPEAAAATLWSHAGGLDDLDAEDLLINLSERSLIQVDQKTDADNKVSRRFSLHDLLHDYAVRVAGEPWVGHQKLVDAYRKKCTDGWHSGPDDGYFFERLPVHLYDAGITDELSNLLTDFRWIRAKLQAKGVYAVEIDFDINPGDTTQRLLRDALRLSAHVLWVDKAQLPSQLTGRLLSFTDEPLQRLVADVRKFTNGPWMRPLHATLTPPGGPLLRTLAGHTRSVKHVVLSRDGLAVSSSDDHTLRVWDLETGESRELTGHTGVVSHVALSGDREAVSASWDSTLRVWDLETGESRELKGHTGAVNHVALSADGQAVSASWDGTLRVWNLETGESRELTGHTNSVNHVALCGDGRAVSASDDHTLRVWDLETGESRELTGHTGVVSHVALSGDREAVSASWDSTLRVWDLETGESRELKGHTGAVNHVALSADGRAVSVSGDHTLHVWNLETGESRELTGHTNSVNHVALSGDGRAVSASDDDTLRVWNLETGESRELKGHTRWVHHVALSGDGRAVSASDDHTLRVWNLETEKSREMKGHTGSVYRVALSPDGRAVSASRDGTLRVWNLKTGVSRELKGHTGWAHYIALSGDGRMVSASDDHTLCVWDLETEESRDLTGHTGVVNYVALSGDGRMVSASDDHTLRVWNLETGESRELKGHTGAVKHVALSADGRAVSASEDGTLRVWNLETGESRELKGHTGSVYCVALSSDGRAVSASSDHTLRVWNLETGVSRELKGHTLGVGPVQLCADGRAVSASADRTLRVWNLETGESLVLQEHTGWVLHVALCVDGRAVLVPVDNTLRVWSLETRECLARFDADGKCIDPAIASDGRTLVAGDASGAVHFLRLENLP